MTFPTLPGTIASRNDGTPLLNGFGNGYFLLLHGQLVNTGEHANRGQQYGNQAGPEGRALHAEIVQRDGIRLTCKDDGVLGWLPSGEVYATIIILFICFAAFCLQRSRVGAERLIVIVAITSAILSSAVGMIYTYEIGCWSYL